MAKFKSRQIALNRKFKLSIFYTRNCDRHNFNISIINFCFAYITNVCVLLCKLACWCLLLRVRFVRYDDFFACSHLWLFEQLMWFMVVFVKTDHEREKCLLFYIASNRTWIKWVINVVLFSNARFEEKPTKINYGL